MQSEKVDRKTFKKRIIAHRMRIIIITAICLLAIAAIIFACIRMYDAKMYTSYTVVSEVERTTTENSKVLGFGNQFITYSADGIHCTDSSGKDVWSFSFEMQNIMLDINGNYVSCCDYNGRTIYIFGSSGLVGQISTNAPIKNICVSATGVVAAVIDDGLVTPINLYYYDGTQIASFRTTMSKSGYPVAVGISDDSKLVGVSYLYLDSGVLMGKVAFYNFGEVGQNETDNLVSGYDFQNELIPSIHFLSNKNAFALANDKLIFFEGKERPTSNANILLQGEVRALFYGDNRVGLLYLNETGESKYRLDVYDAVGNIENSLMFDIEYSDIFFANDCVIIYNSSEAVIYTSNGTRRFEGQFNSPVSLVVPTSSELRYTLVTDSAIQTIVLDDE